MIEGIIVGILSLIGTLAGTYFANRKSSALIAYRLELLEKKVDKHNSVVERTFKLEEQTAVIEEKMILSILVDTFSSRILNPMLLPSGKRNIVVF